MRVPGQSNLLTQPTYDTVQVAVAAVAQTISFFLGGLNTVMAGAVLKTYADTNMVQNGRLDKGKSMKVHALSMSIRDLAVGGAQITRADYQTLLNRSHINFEIGNTSFLRLRAIELPAANAQYEYRSNIAAAVTEFSMWHGATHYANMFYFHKPLELEDQESIQVDLTIEAAIVAVCDVTLTMWGTQARPVR